MPNHGQGHEIRNGVLPDDPVIFWPRGFGHMRVSANNGVIVRISAWYHTNEEGEFIVIPTETINMTPYIPTTENHHNTNLIYYDLNTESYNVVKGTEIIFSALTPPPIPSLPHNNTIPTALVRLKHGQTDIDDALDITDVKQFINTPSTQQNNIIELEEQDVTPDTPDTGSSVIYAKEDGLYILDDSGIETGPFTSNGGTTISGTQHVLAKFSSGSGVEDSRVVDNGTSLEIGSDTSLEYNGVAIANGKFSANGDAQTIFTTIRAKTTNTTPTEMFIDGSSQRLVMPPYSTWIFQIDIIVSDGWLNNSETAAYKIEGVIKNPSTITLLGTPVITTFYEYSSNLSVSVSADTTNDALKVEVTGIAKPLTWVGTVKITQVIQYAE